MPDFRIFIRSNGRHILWASDGNTVTPDQLKKLSDNGSNEVFIDIEDGFKFDQYLENNLGNILRREESPIQQKAEIFSKVTNKVIDQTFITSRDRGALQQETVDRVSTVVENAISFIAKQDS